MKLIQNLIQAASMRILPVLLLAFVFASSAFAQGTIDANDPGTYVGDGNAQSLQVALTVLLSYFSSMFPAAAKYKSYIRAAVVAMLVTGAFVIFKAGALNAETFQLIFKTFLPNFAFSGIAWEGLKWVLGLLRITIKPTA